MNGNTNKRISSNKKLKEIALVIAIILGIIAIQFGVSKYIFNKEKATQLNFYEYRIQQSEIVISPETYTGEEVTVTITAEKPGLSVQYQVGNDGEWIDYTGPFSVDENTKINTRYVAAKDNFEGPITDKDVKNIAVAKIGDTYYKTLEAAIAACPENAEDTQTKIEMLTDVTESVVIPAGKNVLLDLCGVTVTGKNAISDATITVNGKFNIIDSTGDGKIVSSANCSAVKVTSTGDFTIGTNESEPIVSITNPIITGDKYGVIIETNGRFNFYDGKVMGKTNAINGSVTNKPNAYDISITLKGDSEIQSEKEYEIAVLTKTYVITYNGNCDNAEVEYLTETKKSGEKIGKLPTAQREGYLLKGWYTQPTDGTKITVDTVVSENTTYYAQWEAYTYTIIYNSNDKTKTTKNVACKYDADVIIEENSFTAPKGYTFKNWNTKEDETGIIYNPATTVKNLTNKQSGIINLYAIWEDTIEPNTEAPTAIATTSTITVQFNQTDDGTGINESTIEYAIKINGTWSDWQTGNTFENLTANTKCTIKTRVIDNAGNGPTESVETEITTKNIEIGSIELRKNDINGETITPTTNKDDKSNQINNDINIKVTPAKTGTTTVVVKNQSGVTETITKENSTETADGGFQKTITTETGLYEITTITSDGTNETTETVYVYVDKTAPTVNSTNTKTTNTITVQANAVDEDSGLQTVTYEIKKGNTVIATNTTGKFTQLEDDTEYTITIIATDKAGNTTTDIQKIKTNKLVPGSLTFIEDPSNTSFIPSENIWINENVKTTLIPGNAGTTYEVTSPDGTTKKYTTTQTIETVTGTYTVVLTTTDGTNTETVNYTFNVDKIAPTVAYGTNGGTYTIPVGSTKYTISSKITVTDNGGSKIADITYAWSTSNTTQPETWVTTTNGAIIENEVTGGKYYLWVKTTDNAGNETITKTSPFDIGYAIEYDKNGGTGTITNQRKTHGTNITLNNGTGLSKTGYTFIGWSENQTATQAQYGKNASYTANKSVKLYAVWQANIYDISYVLNGGTNNSSNPSTYTYGKGATLSNATKQGYTFDGWYTESTFENKITSISTTQTGNITVYAKYNEITYTLTYDLAGGSLATGKVNPSNYTIGMTDFTLNNPTKTGYSFKGWTGGVVNAKGEIDNTAETGTTENTTTPQTILVIKQGSLGNRKYTANWVDDIPPSTDVPSAVASTSTITVTSNQKDEGTGIASVKYAISEDGITWSEWQESDVFTALQPDKEYYVKTQATDNAGNNSESESKKVKTESLEAGSLAFYKNNINGASITPATTAEEEKPWVNSDIYVAMTRGTNGTTTYEVTSPDGTKQTYTNNATIPTVTGEYTITVITTDGNNTITKTYYIDVDKELPTAVYGTNGGTYTILVGSNTTNVSTKVTAQDNGGSGLSSVEYVWSKDSGTTPTEWTQTTSGATLTQSLEGGKSYLWIKTTDNAGNENIQISNEFNVGYEVKYNSNKGTGTIESQRKEDGVTLKLNDGKGFARDGYTLLGWARSADATSVQYNLGGNFLLNEPSTLYAVWEANSNTVYKVEFYNQSNGTYSQTPTKTENRTGTTDTTVSITEQDKTAPAGYAYDTAAANIETGTVAGNGSLVLKVYYKQQFTVKYKPGTQGTFEETVFENLDYGTTTPEYTKSKTGKSGYTFAKWSPEIATTVTENIEYIATWSANTDTKYKVEHYKQTLTGTYELEETENLTGTTDETATAIAKTYDGFTENETNTSRIPTGTIAGDGSLTLKLYYDRNSYELTINHYVQNADDNKFTLNKTQTESGKVFGSTIEINTKKIDIENATYSYGTDSTGTTKTTITIASSNNVINLYYIRNTATLTVNHYVENANNAQYTLQSTKEIENIKIGSTITLANYVDTGIENVSLNTEKTQTTTIMSANGTTINLYYSRNTYVLTLSKNANIQSATGDGTYKWGQSVTINATVATQTGYTYTWNKWESNNTSLLANQTSRQVTITMPVGNVTLKATATKTANKYSIEYNSNGGSGTTASTQCTYDVEATIAQNAFVGPEGYKGFVKWNTNADGTGTTYNPGDKVKNLNSTQGGKVILYAIWEDIDAPQNEAPSAVANTNTITVTCNQTDSGTGIDETTIQYAIYKDGAWSEWQDSNIFTGLTANTQYKVKTKVSDKAGNGPTESEETTKSTTSIELGTLVFHKDSQTGNIINAPTAEPENPTYINNNIYIDMTAGPVGTTTYTVKDPDGVTTTYSEDKLITTKTGKYEITITTTDNVNSPSETYYIYVDKTNPTLKPTYTKTTNSIKVTANAQDADSGIDKITYVIKNGSTVIATNTTGKFTGLQNNFEYTVVTTVTDKAGNSASKTEIVKTNQLTVGTITFKKSTTNTTFTPSADVWVNDDVKTTLVPGSAGTTTYEVTSPDGTKQTYTSSATLTTVNGTYTVTVKTTDGTNTKTRTYTFNVDKTEPTITFGTNGGTYTIPVGSTTIQISSKITGEDEGGSGISSVQYAWSTSNTTTPTQWTTIENGGSATLSAQGGKQYLWAKTEDKAGNEKVSTTAAFEIGYAIEYDVKGGTGTIANQRKVHGTNITLNSGSSLSKKGYTFKGWDTSETATKVVYAGGASYTTNQSVKLYAVWQINTYKITYNLNGGSLEQGKTNPTTYNINTATITLKNPTNISKPGYNFTGWTGSNGTTPSKSVTIAKGSTGNKTYTANWEEKTTTYTVEHYKENLDGTYTKATSDTQQLTAGINTEVTATYKTYTGFSSNTSYESKVESGNVGEDGSLVLKLYYSRKTITVTYNYQYNGGSTATKTTATLKYGASVDLTPTATKDNYTFVGWNTNKDAKQKLSTLTAGTSNITLYAIYSKKITVTYNKNGGSANLTQTYTMYNNETTLSITYPTTPTTYTGWTFECFGDTATSTTGYAKGATRNVTIASATKTLTYYHNWSKNITLTFIDYKNTTKTTRTANTTVYNGNKATLNVPAQNTYTGWTKRGWTTSTSNTAEPTLNAAGGSISNVTANATYYGLYSKNVTVTFNTNGSIITNISNETGTRYTNSYAISTIKNPSITIPSNTIKKPGYTWNEKWNDKIDGSGTSYTKGTSYTFTADKTLYPEYAIDSYAITYNLNGGSLATGVTNPTSYNVKSSNITLNNPTKTGYVFNGWEETIKNIKWTDGFTDMTTGYIQDSTTYPNSVYSEPILLKAGNTYTDSIGTDIRWRIYNLDGTYVGNKSSQATYTPESDCYAIIVHYTGLTEEQQQNLKITVQDPILDVTIPTGSTGNREYKATWDTDTVKYTVYHYLENANDTGYTLHKTERKDGQTNETITLANEKITIANSTYKQGSLTAGGTAATTTTVAANSSTKIYLYYTRNKYKLTLNKNGNIASTTGAGTYKWGQTVNISATLGSTSGYTYKWTNWTSSNTNLLPNQTEQAATITMPAGAITLTANATKTANKYTVTYNYVQNGGNSSTASTKTVTYGTAVDLTPTATKANYVFIGWNTSSTATTGLTSYKMPAKNVTLYAIFKKAVAKIETGTATTYYLTLQDAIDAAGTTKTTVTMIDDVSLPTTVGTVAPGENIVLDLNGHTIQTTGEDIYVIRNTGNLEIQDTLGGGKLTSTTSGIIYNSESGKCVLTTGTIEAGEKNAISNNTNATFEMNGGTITSEAQGINSINTAKVIVKGGKIETVQNAIYNVAGTVEIKGGTLTSGSYAVVRNNEDTGIINISAGTLKGESYGVYNAKAGTINVSGGTITSTGKIGIYNTAEGTLTIGTNETTPSVSTTVPSITGKTYGVQAGGTFNFYDGVIKGQSGKGTSINGTITATPTGYGVRKTSSTADSVTTETAVLVPANYAEYNGSTIVNYYETLASATTYATNGNTIKPLVNRTETIEVTVTASKNITLDLNGKTITLKNQTLKNNGTLTITGSGTLTGSGANTVTNAGTLTKTGTSKIINTSTSAYGAIGNTGTATISAGTITSAYRTITNSNKLTITGGTITGSDIAVNNSGTATVTGGTVTSTGKIGIYNTTDGKLTIGTNETTPSVNTTVPSITGKTYGVQAGGTFNFYDGVIKGQSGAGTSINGTITATPTGYFAKKTVENDVETAILEQAHTLTINPNGGTWNGKSAVSTVVDAAKAIISLGKATAPNPYVVTYNPNYTGSSTTSVNATRVFEGWTLSGAGNLVNSSAIEEGSFTKTVKTESAGEYFRFTKTVSTALTTSTYYGICLPNYEYTSGNSYTIKFKLRINQLPEGASLKFRHAAINNDYATEGLVKKYYDSTTNGWVDVYMTRTFTGTTITQDSTTYDITPRFEMYTSDIKDKTGTFNFDIKDVMIINNTTGSLIQSTDYAYMYGTNDGTVKAKYTTNAITLKALTRNGYTFLGWYKEAACTNKVGSAGSLYTPTGNITLYAKWRINNYEETSNNSHVEYYETLAEAISSANSGNRIVALNNRTETESATIPSGKTLTFNLAGRTVTLNGATLTNNGTLTIEGNGTLTGSGANTVTNNGTFRKIDDSTIKNTSTSNYCAIKNTGTATIERGTISGEYRAIETSGTQTLTVKGGETSITAKNCAVFNKGTANTTSVPAVKIGNVKLIESTDSVSVYNNASGLVYITGGIIKQQGSNSAIVNNSTGTIQLVSSTIQNTGTAGYAINNASTGTVKVEGGNTVAGTINNGSTGRIEVSGGTITSATTALYNTGAGTINVTGGTITGQNTQAIRGGTGTVSISGSPKITGKVYGVSVTTGTLTITGGTIEATEGIGAYAYNADEVATLTIGTNEATPSVNTSVPSITGKTYGVQVGGTFNFYDGILKGKSGPGTAINGTITATPTGYDVYKTVDNDDIESAILTKNFTLTINPNGGTWNGTTSTSKIVDNSRDIISIGEPTPPTPYVVTYNHNYTGSTNKTANATRIFDIWKLTSGDGTVVGASDIEATSFTKTNKTETAGEYINFKKVVSTAPTESVNYRFNMPNYTYRSGYSYTIKFKLRINQLPEGGVLNFRHAAINNDYATDGLVKKVYNTTTDGWIDVYMTRKFTGTTITQKSTTYNITPRFEMYTSDFKDKTGTFDFDIKDVMIIDNSSYYIVQSTNTAYMYRLGNGTITAQYTTNSINLETPTRTGYTFDGWYKEAACTNKVGDAGAEYTPISNITLYAKWKQNNYEEVTSSGAHVNYYVSLASAMANVTSGNTIKALNNMTETVSSTVTASKTVTFNLNGKTVTLNSSSLTNNGKLTITGTGTLTGTSGYTIRNIGTLTKTGASSIKNEGTSQTTVIVNEGTATISAGTINGSYKGIETKGTGTLTISGATVTAKNYAVYSQGTANTTTAPAVKIVSGTIESTAAVSVYNNATGLIYATGGTIKQQGSNSVIANNSTGTIQLSGATVEKSSGTGGYAAIYNISTGTIKVTSGNINNSVSRAIYNKGAGTINVTGGTISGTVGIDDVEGSISVTSGTINATNGVGIRVGTGTAIISGSSTKITGTTYGVDATTGTTTIKAGTIQATDGIGVQVAGGTLTIGTNETTPSVSTTVPSITGSTKGVNVSSGTFNFYDGVIKGQSGAGTSIVGTVTATPTNYNVYKTVDNDNVESAILMQEHTLTVNQNGGVWNGSSAISRVKDVTKSVISIGEPIAPSPYVITCNQNVEGRPDVKLNAIRVFDGWTLSGAGSLVNSSAIKEGSFTKTVKTESAGEYFKFTKTVSTAPTTSTYYGISLPNYEYTSGNSYTIKFKLRINQLPSGVSLGFRHAAINNDYATEGLVKKNYSSTSGEWVDVYMTRTFTGTTIVQGSTTYDITPRFEMYTNDIKGKTGTFDFDIKDVRVINNTTGKLVQSTDIAYMYGNGDGTIKSNYKVEPTNLIIPVRDGYICEGWYKEAECTNKVGNAGSSYTATGNVTLYAKWKETNYEEVTLDGTHVNYYITLASAMANVTSGNTIKVLVDRTETIASTVTKSKTVILDLNGKTVTLNGVTLKVNGALKITGEGTLTGSGANTITNAGSLTKTGTSTIANTSTSSYYTIKNTGNATLEAGTLTSAYRTIDNSETGEVVVSGATVNSTGEGHTIYNTSTANTTDAPAVKVTSGTVSAVAGISGNSAIRSIGTGLVYLTGGTIESESIYTLYLTNSSLQVDGATIKNTDTENAGTGTAISSNGSIKVISGTITSDIGEAMNGSEQITISGGTIQGGTTGITITNANAKLKISGGTIKGTTQAGVLVGDSTVEITGGTITGGGSSTEGVAGILHTGTGSILMYNGKVTCEPGVNYGVKQTGSGTIEVFGGSISSGNGGTGIKQTAGYIRLLETSARYSGAVVSGYYNAIDLTGSTETVELEIGDRSATFDDNSDYKLRRPYISGTGSTILGDNSTNIEITFGNGTIKTTGGSTGQTGGGTTAAYAFFDIPDSQITVRNGYVKQTNGGLYETNYTYLVPEGSANSTNSDNTNTANISNETNTLLKARVTSKLMSVLNNTNKEQNSSNAENNVSDNTTNQNTIENTKDNNTSEKTKDNNTSEDTKDNNTSEDTKDNTENNENTVKNTEQNTNETTETDTTNSNENVVEIPKVVQTGGKNYATLAEAINSAENDGMIEILDDISLTEKVTIDESKNIKLSLNSKTISCTSSSTLVNNGTLTIISSGIIRNETDNGVVITNNGTLNIQEGIITTAKNGGKGIYNTKTLNVSGGKIVTEGIGAVGIYNVTKSQLTVTGGIIEITGFGSKAIYNNSEVVFEENSNKNIIPKVVVSGDDGIGIYNSKDSTKCDIKSGEFIVEAEVIENYDLIKNTNEFKSELEKMKPSYGIYNDSEIDVNIEKATIKVERLKGVGILNNSIGSIVLGKNDETLNLATPIIYAISDNTTAIINTKAPYANSADSIATNEKYGNIKFYDGTMSTLVSIKDVVTVILDKHEIVENKGNSVINTILKIIEKQ